MRRLPRGPARPQRGAMWWRMAAVWERTRPEGSWSAGGAKCGGGPTLEASASVASRVEGEDFSVYGIPAYSSARRTYSPRPGSPGHYMCPDDQRVV